MIKSRNAFKLFMRFLVNTGLEPQYAFVVASAKTREELADICKPHGMLVSDMIQLIDFANYVTARSGFDMIDRRVKKGA